MTLPAAFASIFEPISQLLALPDAERLARMAPLVHRRRIYLNGLWYSVTVLAILGCHEMGHYVPCLRYGVDATRPYFLPAPLPFLTGTLGAFIRIRSRIPDEGRALRHRHRRSDRRIRRRRARAVHRPVGCRASSSCRTIRRR